MTGVRAPIWRRAARAAALAGLLGGAPSTVHALATGADPLAATRAAGTLLPGHRREPDLLAGVVAHIVVTLLWTGLLAAMSRWFRLGPWRGAAAGVAIAALDLGVVAPRAFPLVADLPQLPQWADHLAFGAIVGATLRR